MTEQFFLLGLLLKIVMTATIVVTATIIVERTGPFIGALIAALPTAAGAVYIILALEHAAGLHRRQRGRQHGVQRVRNAVRLYLRAARAKARACRQYHRRLCRLVSLRGACCGW